MPFPSFSEFFSKRRTTQSPDDVYQLDQQQPRTVATKQYELPKIDSDDAIGSLAGILGPTPEEREAEEQRLQEHRKKMHGWTALFNGLRHLGNLYYASKGASPQKYGDPHVQIEQQYQDERRRLAEIEERNRQYYSNLWGLYRQIGDEQRKNMLAEAQRDYYGTRDEMARQKAERERYNYQKMSNGSIIKIDKDEGTATEISEADPQYVKWRDSQIIKNQQQGNAAMIRANKSGGKSGSSGITTTENIYNDEGKVVKKVVTKGSAGAKSSGSGQKRNGVRKSRTQL